MSLTRILVVVLAGGAGGRLDLLTENRAKPAVAYGGMYRLIDFPLSNCQRAGIADVWVIQQYNPRSLSDHLANGRPWDLDRTTGGLLVVHPHQGNERGGWHQGTVDALWRQAPMIREFDPEALVVVSADAVYKLDYREVVEGHLDSDAAVTMVTTRVDKADASRYGVVLVADDGGITDYAYKPDDPASDLVSNEVFVFTPDRVLDLLDELAEGVDEGSGLEDLGDQVLPKLVEAGEAREHRFEDTGVTAAPSRRTGSRTWICSKTSPRSISTNPAGESRPQVDDRPRRGSTKVLRWTTACSLPAASLPGQCTTR
ncbi:MAG: glucose-1-phosphate adenylyltransferase family protein [Geodermatophilaceae bacterium]